MRSLCLLPLFALGCAEDTVILSGRLGDGPGVDAPGLSGAQIEVVDTETGEQLIVGTSSSDGAFSFLVPPGRNVAALVRGEGLVTASFGGVTGFIDVALDDGSLYGVSPDLVSQWRKDFAGCPSDDARVFAFGRMEYSNLKGDQKGLSPIAGGGRAELLTGADPVLACYLDPKTERYEPTADRTGATGRFAIFGVPDGSSALDVIFEWGPNLFDTPGAIEVYVPDTNEEVVVPYLPLRLEFPLK